MRVLSSLPPHRRAERAPCPVSTLGEAGHPYSVTVRMLSTPGTDPGRQG